MSSDDQIIKTTLTLPNTLHWKLKEEIPRRRTTFKGAVIEALELWLAQKGYQSLPISEDQEIPETDGAESSGTLPAKAIENLGISSANVTPNTLHPQESPAWAEFIQHFQAEATQLKQILESGHPDAAPAIRANLRMFSEAIQRWLADERQPAPVPSQERVLSADEVDRIRKQGEVARELARNAKRASGKRDAGRGRREPPAGGTGTGG